MFSSFLSVTGGLTFYYVDRYKNDPEIMAMTNLVSAYQRRDVHEAEKILRGTYLPIRLFPILSHSDVISFFYKNY